MASPVIADRLKKARISAGYSQKDMCEMLSIPQSTFSSWEVGKSEPNAETLLSLCSIYGISSFSYFIGGDDDAPSPEALEVARLYDAASDDDRRVVHAALDKYRPRGAAPARDLLPLPDGVLEEFADDPDINERTEAFRRQLVAEKKNTAMLQDLTNLEEKDA